MKKYKDFINESEYSGGVQYNVTINGVDIIVEHEGGYTYNFIKKNPGNFTDEEVESLTEGFTKSNVISSHHFNPETPDYNWFEAVLDDKVLMEFIEITSNGPNI